MEIFKENPFLDVVYKTTDGKYFYTEDSARVYAKGLKDNAVEKLVRPTPVAPKKDGIGHVEINSDDDKAVSNPIEVKEDTQEVKEKTNNKKR